MPLIVLAPGAVHIFPAGNACATLSVELIQANEGFVSWTQDGGHYPIKKPIGGHYPGMVTFAVNHMGGQVQSAVNGNIRLSW